MRSGRLSVGCLLILGTILCCSKVGAREPWTTSQIHGQPTRPHPYKLELIYPKLKFRNPKCVVQIPGADRLLIAHDSGKLVSVSKANWNIDTTSLVVNLPEEEGVGADANTVAFHPDFATNRWIFVAMGHGENGWHSRVMRYTLTDETEPKVVPGSGKFIIRWPAGGHGGGCLAFAPDGNLYISTGDGSGPSPPDKLTTGQDISDLLGAVLRINVDDPDKPYVVPSDNPFVDMQNARPEIWSYGLRNPWKFGIDSDSGDIFVADNGWETWELIHKIDRGSNCGWPIMEGRARLRTEVKQGPTPIVPPIKDHPHTEANSVIGGPVYRGRKHNDLHGWFVYGDYITGTLWCLRQQDGELEHRTLADSDIHIVDLAEGSDGEIFALDFDTTQQLYRVVPSNTVDQSAQFPRTLSATGLFANVEKLETATGVVPYKIKSEPWMDGASAQRWVAIPDGNAIDLGEGSYPDGTVLVKHLSIPCERIDGDLPLETQLLHYEDGSWNPYSYLWDDDGKDATLVDYQGTEKQIQLTGDSHSTRTWRAGSTNECRLCHNAGSDFVLGFQSRQLDVNDQLGQLVADQVLGGKVEYGGNALVDPHDETEELDDRARSYLHMNCGICHNRQGPATISFFAHRDYEFDALRITKHPGIGNFGIEAPQLVKPGLPYKSIILYRLAKLGYGRMPYVGSRVVDSKGIGLIEEWISSLDDEAVRNANATSSGLVEALSTTERALALVARMHRGKLDAAAIKQAYTAAQSRPGDIRGLFEQFIPESNRRRVVGQNPELNSILELDGLAERGKLIFLSDNARCKSCHDTHDPLKSLGPTLAEIRAKYPRRNEMLTHILQPSTKVDEKYATWTVIQENGKVHVGMIQKRTPNSVTLVTADKKQVVVPKNSIDEMVKSSKSLMPAGILSDLTHQEAADLLAFLMQENAK